MKLSRLALAVALLPGVQAFAADLFFDDQTGHCLKASQVVATGHVPHGVSNPPQP